jgi:hypothetical protein
LEFIRDARPDLFDDCSDFMTENHRIILHGHRALERVQVPAAKTYHTNAKQHLTRGGAGPVNIPQLGLAGLDYV